VQKGFTFTVTSREFPAGKTFAAKSHF
jgi:hypothetical protein